MIFSHYLPPAFLSTTMYLFIVLSLAFCFAAQTESPWQNALISPTVIAVGLFLAAAGIVGSIFKKNLYQTAYDLFAGGTLLVWFAYWHPQFNDDSPFFFFFPLYFLFLATFIELFFLGQQNKIDNETFRRMQSLAQNNSLQPWLLMLLVLASLELQQHYLLYPVLMTLLMLRFTLSRCLERK